jgi:hypothetical protein
MLSYCTRFNPKVELAIELVLQLYLTYSHALALSLLYNVLNLKEAATQIPDPESNKKKVRNTGAMPVQ